MANSIGLIVRRTSIHISKRFSSLVLPSLLENQGKINTHFCLVEAKTSIYILLQRELYIVHLHWA